MHILSRDIILKDQNNGGIASSAPNSNSLSIQLQVAHVSNHKGWNRLKTAAGRNNIEKKAPNCRTHEVSNESSWPTFWLVEHADISRLAIFHHRGNILFLKRKDGDIKNKTCMVLMT